MKARRPSPIKPLLRNLTSKSSAFPSSGIDSVLTAKPERCDGELPTVTPVHAFFQFWLFEACDSLIARMDNG